MAGMGRLEEKVAIITGAGQGIGRGIALALAREGASISLPELNPDTGAATAAEIERLGVRGLFVPCDVSSMCLCSKQFALVISNIEGNFCVCCLALS